jgi:general secretion pathway protein H
MLTTIFITKNVNNYTVNSAPIHNSSHYIATKPLSAQGFTLLEVMIVIVIISVLSSFVALSLQDMDKSIQFKNEAKRLNHVIALAREEAILNSEILGLRFRKNCYSFMFRKNTEWIAYNDRIFGPHEIPQGIEFQLLINGMVTPLPLDKPPKTPQIAIWPSGEVSPFELNIKSTIIQSVYTLIGNEFGSIEMTQQN